MIDRPIEVAALAATIDEAQILATITALSTSFPNRYHAHPSGTASANWIRDLWAGYAAGRPEVTVELYSHGGITPQPSVILTIPGTTLADEVVILGGHQDSIRSGLLRQSRLHRPGRRRRRLGDRDTLRGAAGGARGRFHAAAHRDSSSPTPPKRSGSTARTTSPPTYFAAGIDVVAVLQQDMTGYHGSIEDMALISDYTHPELTAFLGELLDTYQPGTPLDHDHLRLRLLRSRLLDEPRLSRGVLLRVPDRRPQSVHSLHRATPSRRSAGAPRTPRSSPDWRPPSWSRPRSTAGPLQRRLRDRRRRPVVLRRLSVVGPSPVARPAREPRRRFPGLRGDAAISRRLLSQRHRPAGVFTT